MIRVLCYHAYMRSRAQPDTHTRNKSSAAVIVQLWTNCHVIIARQCSNLALFGPVSSDDGPCTLFFLLMDVLPSSHLVSSHYSLSRSISVITQIRGHIAGRPPPLSTTAVPASSFFNRDTIFSFIFNRPMVTVPRLKSSIGQKVRTSSPKICNHYYRERTPHRPPSPLPPPPPPAGVCTQYGVVVDGGGGGGGGGDGGGGGIVSSIPH